MGKGGNIIISMLHHFLETHRFGEVLVHFHADNCCGQNKNRYLMAYFMWRILVGLHEDIKISFLPVGHTKFAPDWCFGLSATIACKIGCLDDIVHAVNQSATPNVAQLIILVVRDFQNLENPYKRLHCILCSPNFHGTKFLCEREYCVPTTISRKFWTMQYFFGCM